VIRPVLTRRPMMEYSAKRQLQICKCTPRCATVVMMVQDEFVYPVCERGAIAFAYEILSFTDTVPDAVKLEPTRWTPKEQLALIEYMKRFPEEIPRGTYTHFGAMYRKTNRQVKHKIQELRQKGQLPPSPKKEKKRDV
jgi:hypothetical protein